MGKTFSANEHLDINSTCRPYKVITEKIEFNELWVIPMVVALAGRMFSWQDTPHSF